MDSKDFIRTCADTIEAWLRKVARRISTGELSASGPFSFPTVLRAAETPHHFIAELCGATASRDPNKLRLERPTTIERVADATTYFNGEFASEDLSTGMLVNQFGNNWLSGLTLTTEIDSEMFRRKVNFDIPGTVLKCNPPIPLQILPTADWFGLQNVTVLRTEGVRLLFRTISTAICVRKQTDSGALQSWILQQFDSQLQNGCPVALNLFSASARDFGRELCSLADQNISESILDRFINSHGHHFQRALGYKGYLAQPRLEWTQRQPTDPHESIPDYMLRRSDGHWDILDLKRGVIRNKSIVRGLPARPRFIDYVNEMIAQLARYESYFERPENAELARRQLGVVVNKPRLFGIVGNFDSFDIKEVRLAMTPYKDNLVVMSYDDIVGLLRSSEAQLVNGRSSKTD